MTWEVQLAAKIAARIKSDTGSGGAWETAGVNKLTGVMWKQLPENQELPFVMFEYARKTNVSPMQRNSHEVDLRVHLFVHPDAGDARAGAIRDRLLGNWQAQGGTPTYGLDHWQPTGLADWDVTHLGHRDSIDQDEVDALHLIDQYVLQVTEQDP